MRYRYLKITILLFLFFFLSLIHPVKSFAQFAGEFGAISATISWGNESLTNGGGFSARSGESIFQYIVVYNPDGGFVTGGGTINSPVGAYISDATLSGKANFGFISKYEHGSNIPTGQTEFQFKVAGLNFHSTSYDWLVIAGAHAKYKGSGVINGVGNYMFMLTTTDGQMNNDGSTDKFRLKIWKKDTNVVVYDNQLGSSDEADATADISSGSIVIHK